MHLASNNIMELSVEPVTSLVSFVEPQGNLVVLDETALDEANGGVAPLLIVGAAAGGFTAGVGAAIGVGYLVKKLF